MSVALEGFTHLIPFAAGHEIMRQRYEDLTLVRMTPDIIFDQLIGMGSARKVVFSWGGNPGVGSLHRFRDAIENEYPRKIEIDEHTHAGMVARYIAGASSLPFGLVRAYQGTDLQKYSDTIDAVYCPFSGSKIAAVRSLNPDLTIIHAQQADRKGNVAIWGITGIQKEAVLAAKSALITVEEVRPELSPPTVGAVILPHWIGATICEVPNGSHPSYASGYTTRDSDFYLNWHDTSKDRTRFKNWMAAHVMSTADHDGYLVSLNGCRDD